MSKISDISKLYFILEKIEDLEEYIAISENIFNLLNNKLSYDASLMCLLQIGETLNKLVCNYDKLDIDDIKGSYDVRNFIAHDYEGIHKSIIEDIIRYSIPKLKTSIKFTIEDIELSKKELI